MPTVKRFLQLLPLCMAISACTPSYTQQASRELLDKTGLTGRVDFQRSNQRLLSRQSQVCLVSDVADTDKGSAMLRSMQLALGGYFVAVGVENEAMDYQRALATTSCPGAAYLFYVQPLPQLACHSDAETCANAPYSQFRITIVSNGERSLVDRVQFSIKNSSMSVNKSTKNNQQRIDSGAERANLDQENQKRLQQAFEQLAGELTGSH